MKATTLHSLSLTYLFTVSLCTNRQTSAKRGTKIFARRANGLALVSEHWIRILKSFVVLVLLTNPFVLINTVGYACSCADPLTPRREMKKARAVFAGEVIEIKEELTQSKELTDAKYLCTVRFKVERYWKGINSPEIVVLTNLATWRLR